MDPFELNETRCANPMVPKNQENNEPRKEFENDKPDVGDLKMQAISDDIEEGEERESKLRDSVSQANDSDMENGLPENQNEQLEKDTNDDEGNISDNSAVDAELRNRADLDTYSTWYGIETRRQPITERRTKRDRHRRQHHRYVLNLDDRVYELEKKIEGLLGGPEPSSKKKAEPEIPRVLPEIATRTWDEYFEHKGKKVSSVHSAIEILTEDPVIVDAREPQSMNSTSRSKHRLGSEKASVETTSSHQLVGPTMESLPERIRINSEALCTFLRSLPAAGILSKPGFPVVLRRPFKILLHHEDTIHNEAEESKKQLQRGNDGHEEEAEGSLIKTQEDQEISNTITENSASMVGENDQARPGPSKDAPSTPELLPQLYRLLVQLIDEYIKPTQEATPQRSRIHFHELWYLYHPGQLVYNRLKESPQKF